MPTHSRATRVTFLLPRRLDRQIERLRRADPSMRTRTDALLRAITTGLRELTARTAR